MSISVGLFGETASEASLCAKIAKHETLLQEGVIKLLEGVSVRVDMRYRLIVRIRLMAEFGFDVVRLAANVQDAVYRAIATATDLQVYAIHVRIADVKYRTDSGPQTMNEAHTLDKPEFAKELLS